MAASLWDLTLNFQWACPKWNCDLGVTKPRVFPIRCPRSRLRWLTAPPGPFCLPAQSRAPLPDQGEAAGSQGRVWPCESAKSYAGWGWGSGTSLRPDSQMLFWPSSRSVSWFKKKKLVNLLFKFDPFPDPWNSCFILVHPYLCRKRPANPFIRTGPEFHLSKLALEACLLHQMEGTGCTSLTHSH